LGGYSKSKMNNNEKWVADDEAFVFSFSKDGEGRKENIDSNHSDTAVYFPYDGMI